MFSRTSLFSFYLIDYESFFYVAPNLADVWAVGRHGAVRELSVSCEYEVMDELHCSFAYNGKK